MAAKNPVRKNSSKDIILQGEAMDDDDREAPDQSMVKAKDIILPSLNKEQLSIILNKTPDWAVKVRQGKGGRAFKYVTHGYVTQTLNKAFGFDWDLIVDPMADGKMYALELEPIVDAKGVILRHDRHIAVTGRLVVRIHDGKGKLITTIVKSGFGSQMWLPTMEFGDALKAARSDLVKTCAFQLGIALDLYWNERAEIDTHVKKQAAKSEAQRAASEMVAAAVDTPIALLTRSMADFKFDGAKVAEILGTTFDLMMAMNEDAIAEAWKKVQDAGQK